MNLPHMKYERKDNPLINQDNTVNCESLLKAHDELICKITSSLRYSEQCSYTIQNIIELIVEIPTPHGRLIDADALENRVAEWRDCLKFRDAQILCTVIDMIHKAPTVIGAEGVNE